MKSVLFSICIPVRNDPDNLRQCLAGFKTQELADCEIIVCDDGSTPPVADDDLRATGVECTLIRQPGQGPAAARNHCAQIANGRFLFFVDADTVPSADMLERARRIVTSAPDIDAFFGSYDDEPADRGLISSYRNLLHHHTHHHAAMAKQTITTFWCGCGVIRRDLYRQMGGLSTFYDQPSIEDIELGARLSARHIRVAIFPEVQVKHLKRWTLRNWLYTDLFRRGIPWVRLMRARRQWGSQLNFSWAQRIASVAATVFVFCVFLVTIHGGFGVLGLTALAVFLALNRPFFELIRRKRGAMRAVQVMPLHLLYAFVCVVSVGAALVCPPLKLPEPTTLRPLVRP
jgi:glycosyltransferase involved in cell wall biosynthesis